MTIFDTRSASTAFDASDPTIVAYSSDLQIPGVAGWNTTGSDKIYIERFSVYVDRVQFDLDGDGYVDGEIMPFVGTMHLGQLAALKTGVNSFWSTLLGRDDVIFAPTLVSATLFGDYLNVQGSTALTGGQDKIIGGIAAGQTLCGDAIQVGPADSTSGLLVGGRDTITANNMVGTSTLIGDALRVNAGGHLTGNADTLTGSDLRGDLIYGDADLIFNGSAVGGNDTVDGRAGDDIIVGDFNRTQRLDGSANGPSVTGGHDVLRGGDGVDIIIGDFRTVAHQDIGAPSSAVCGNDTIFGDAGNDTIYGDTINYDPAIQKFGRDIIDGGAGDDTIYGDAIFPQGLPSNVDYQGHDIIHGGSGTDRIDGGVGADQLFGDAGIDFLIGGYGNDRLTGGADPDFFLFYVGSGDDRILDFKDNVDELRISSSYGFTSAAQVVATARVSGTDVILHLGANDYVTLVGFGTNPNALVDDLGFI